MAERWLYGDFVKRDNQMTMFYGPIGEKVSESTSEDRDLVADQLSEVTIVSVSAKVAMDDWHANITVVTQMDTEKVEFTVRAESKHDLKKSLSALAAAVADMQSRVGE